MLMIVFGAGCLLLSVLFHAASLLHLGLPLLYALIVPTLFSGWYYSHYALANGMWYALIVLGLISWAVLLVRKNCMQILINSRKIHLTPYMTPCYNESERRDRGDVPCQNGINYWQGSADYRATFVLTSCARCWKATAMKCVSQTAAAAIARFANPAARQLRSLCTNRSRKSTL